jgi:hypothetical protein
MASCDSFVIVVTKYYIRRKKRRYTTRLQNTVKDWTGKATRFPADNILNTAGRVFILRDDVFNVKLSRCVEVRGSKKFSEEETEHKKKENSCCGEVAEEPDDNHGVCFSPFRFQCSAWDDSRRIICM